MRGALSWGSVTCVVQPGGCGVYVGFGIPMTAAGDCRLDDWCGSDLVGALFLVRAFVSGAAVGRLHRPAVSTAWVTARTQRLDWGANQLAKPQSCWAMRSARSFSLWTCHRVMELVRVRPHFGQTVTQLIVPADRVSALSAGPICW